MPAFHPLGVTPQQFRTQLFTAMPFALPVCSALMWYRPAGSAPDPAADKLGRQATRRFTVPVGHHPAAFSTGRENAATSGVIPLPSDPWFIVRIS
jgi:hypothetical protein